MTLPAVRDTSDEAALPWPIDPWWDAWAFWTDAGQRGVLFWDVMRQRGERHQEHAAKAAPHVLGARVPIILTSRADNRRTRMASCAVAVLLAHSRRAKESIRA